MLIDLFTAFSFLTVLPVARLPGNLHDQPDLPDQPGRALAYFPIVGVVIGGIVSAVAAIQFLPRDLVAFLALAMWIILTGGLHLDGFSDACDGLLATVAPERRLEIMRDPRTGSWAVIGVVLLLLGKWIALRTAPPMLLFVPPIIGRCAMVLVVAAFPSARKSGLGMYFRIGLGRTQVIAAAVTTLIAVAVFGARGIACFFVGLPVALLIGRWAAGRLGGGLTGDVYGAICELMELLCLIIVNVA